MASHDAPTSYVVADETQPTYDDTCPQEDEDAENYDDTSYPAFGDEAAEYDAHSYPAGEEDEKPGAESGHVIQLQLAANAAFGKAKGRKGKGRGKGKSEGKVVRSHLTLDERRDKMKALKAI